jgi:hypothetical protein
LLSAGVSRPAQMMEAMVRRPAPNRVITSCRRKICVLASGPTAIQPISCPNNLSGQPDIIVVVSKTNWPGIPFVSRECRHSDTCDRYSQAPALHAGAEFHQDEDMLHSWRVLVDDVPFWAISPLGGAICKRLYRLILVPAAGTLLFSQSPLVSLRRSLASILVGVIAFFVFPYTLHRRFWLKL